MRRPILLAAILVAALSLSSDGKVDDPKFKSMSAKKALDDFKRERAKLEEPYRKGLEKARTDYVKALEEARKQAIKDNDLEEAQRIVATLKEIDDVVTANKMATVRQRLANSKWEWVGREHTIVLNADGTMSATWMPNAKGYWYVNADLTVFWWSTGHGVACVMRFNADFTAHDSYTPKENLPRSGKRIK